MSYSDKISNKAGKLLCSTYLAKFIKLIPSIFQQKLSISVPFVKLQHPSVQNFLADLLQINVFSVQILPNPETLYVWKAWRAVQANGNGWNSMENSGHQKPRTLKLHIRYIQRTKIIYFLTMSLTSNPACGPPKVGPASCRCRCPKVHTAQLGLLHYPRLPGLICSL